MLTEGERKALVRLARTSLHAHLHGAPPPELTEPTATLARPCGVFVSWYHGDMLRGCLGIIDPPEPLWTNVRELAVGAATDDPRFPPVRPDEESALRVSISVLTPPVRVASAEVIDVTRHGVMLKMGARRGVFLPSVAAEMGWDRDMLLDRLCVEKAALPRGAWREPRAELSIFEAEEFGDAVE